MVKNARCQRCKAELTAQEVGGLCANCLLRLAVEPPPHEDTLLSTSPIGPSLNGDSSSPAPPENRFGDYQLVEMIGRGGMGVVYKARQKHLNRMVALKMVQNWRDASLDTLARFQIEARAAAKLDHPNIVPTYQIGELNGQPFFSMKLVAGTSLAKKIPELALVQKADSNELRRPLRPGRDAHVLIASLLAKVARAVHFAHQQGVIHRDLKPSNILLDAEGEPHLTDFGVAKLLEHDSGLTRTNDMLGTPTYMAPEQASGHAASPAVDIYSLGAILYELLTGQPPFKGKSPLETLRKAAEEEPVPPSTINGSADAELAAICLKCLEKNPMHRYSSAQGVAEDLERWIRHEPIHARPAGPVRRAIRWTRRNRLGATLIATLCVGLASALVLLSMVSKEKDKTAAVLQDVERAGQTNAQLLSLTVSLLHEQLEGLWQSSDRRVLQIRSEQLAALSGLPINEVPKNLRAERLKFGLSANESPVSDSRRYAMLLSYLEYHLSERRRHPVRIDLHMFKYKEDRAQALVNGQLDFARMGTVYFLRTKQRYPHIEGLVEMETSENKPGIFVVRTNSSIRSLADLKGRKLAFGDSASSVTFWGLAKLADSGINGNDLADYIFLNSRSEFIEEAHEWGPEAALQRRVWLHSTADVIEEVLSGRADAGVTTQHGLSKHRHRGLAAIPGSDFLRRPSPWVGRGDLPADLKRDLIEILTSLHHEDFMLHLPDRPSGFKAVTEETHAQERGQMGRIETLFPKSIAEPEKAPGQTNLNK